MKLYDAGVNLIDSWYNCAISKTAGNLLAVEIRKTNRTGQTFLLALFQSFPGFHPVDIRSQSITLSFEKRFLLLVHIQISIIKAVYTILWEYISSFLNLESNNYKLYWNLTSYSQQFAILLESHEASESDIGPRNLIPNSLVFHAGTLQLCPCCGKCSKSRKFQVRTADKYFEIKLFINFLLCLLSKYPFW